MWNDDVLLDEVEREDQEMSFPDAIDHTAVKYTPSDNPLAKPTAQNSSVAGYQVTGGAYDYAESYKGVVGKYAELGGQLGKDVISTADKALNVAKDAAIGASIGAAIPILGEIGVGEVGGALIAGIYSAFDNFGDEIHDFFNPPSFEESDYDRMKKNCLISGGIPNWGHAPDNEDGCIYPDGTTSGGDYPRHPPPGRQSIRGDDFVDYNQPGVIFSIPVPTVRPALLPTADEASRLIGARLRASQKRVSMIQALKPGESLPIGAERAYLSASDRDLLNRLVPVTPAILPKNTGVTSLPLVRLNQAAISAVKQAGAATEQSKVNITVRKDLLDKATDKVSAAMSGDASAKQDIAAIVASARGGDPNAIQDARIVTAAHREIVSRQYVAYYNALGKQQGIQVGAYEITGGFEVVGGGGGVGSFSGQDYPGNQLPADAYPAYNTGCGGGCGCQECDEDELSI